MKHVFVVWALMFCCSTGCKKKNVQPADVNAQGEYFNCYIDGQYWTFKQEPYSNNDALTASKGQITLPGFKLQAESNDAPQTVVRLWMLTEDFPSKDTYALTTYSELCYATVYRDYYFPNPTYEVSTNDTLTGQLIFSKREPTRLEGTFFFSGARNDSGQAVRITNGRFSIIP